MTYSQQILSSAQSHENFKKALRRMPIADLEEIAMSLSGFVAEKQRLRAALCQDIRGLNKRLRAIKRVYMEKKGHLPIKEYHINGFVRYRFQSLIHNECLLPTTEDWLLLSRRGNPARQFEVVVKVPRNRSAVKERYGDQVKLLRKKHVSCSSIPISLLLIRQGAKFSHTESWFPSGRCSATRTVSHNPSALWVGRVACGEETAEKKEAWS